MEVSRTLKCTIHDPSQDSHSLDSAAFDKVDQVLTSHELLEILSETKFKPL
jgi:hypothetical protein